MKRVGLLIGGSLLFWVLLAVPARRIWGDSALVFSATAMLLCLIPAAATLIWFSWAYRNSPEQQMMIILGGTAVRLFVVGGAAVCLFQLVPYFQNQQAFIAWLLVAYLFVLVLEKVLVLGGRGATGSALPSRPA